MADFFNTIRLRFSLGSMLMKLIYINIGVFLLLRIVALAILLSGGNTDNWLHLFEVPSQPTLLLLRPWTIFTYMFAQYGILHLLFNMVWLYWFGRIFLFTGTPKQMLALYLYGGIAGALLFIIAYNTLPYFHGSVSWMIGSSASVIAVVTSTAIRHPDYRIGLLFLGEIPLKWIAIATIGISILSIPDGNAGGNIAHIGGAVIGAIYGGMLNRGTDITRPLNNAIDNIVNALNHAASKFKKAEKEQDKPLHNDAETLDSILDKIKRSGYTSLSAEEKRKLFEESKKIK